MNKKTPFTALFAVVALVAVVLLTPTSLGAVKSLAPQPATQPPAVAVDDSAPPVAARPKVLPIPGPVDPEPVLTNVHDAMRHLWMDHIVWSRVVTMSVFSDLKGQNDYEQRLVMNAFDMTELFSPYFGKENAAIFGDLYLRHVTLAAEVFEAYKSGNETAIRAVTYDWYLNSDEISEFLCKINPTWDYGEMQSLWKTHLDTVIYEMLDYQNDDYKGDVMCYDAMQDHAFVLADYMSAGIPEKAPGSK
jgi:hypothetical protein